MHRPHPRHSGPTKYGPSSPSRKIAPAGQLSRGGQSGEPSHLEASIYAWRFCIALSPIGPLAKFFPLQEGIQALLKFLLRHVSYQTTYLLAILKNY